MRLRLGTRGSLLARAQADLVATRLTARGHAVDIVIISTEGDRFVDRPFAEVGSAGVFVRDIEAALISNRIDVAVHSYKDLPAEGPDPLTVAAIPERLDPADVLVARRDAVAPDARLPLVTGAHIGAASARRRALVAAERPDLVVGFLRGNVPTRLEAVRSGRFDATLLAAAGLERLQRARTDDFPVVPRDMVVIRLDPTWFVPAPAQGAIAVQIGKDRHAVREAVAPLHDATVGPAVAAERALLARAEAGCGTPFGACCMRQEGGAYRLIAVLAGPNGSLARADVSGLDPLSLVELAWRELGVATP